MFTKQYRLPPYAKLSQARTYTSPYFIMKLMPNALAYNRYGFVVSKRVDSRATARNKVKRQIRSCAEVLHPTLLSGFDILFIIKRNAVNVHYETLMQAMKDACTKQRLVSI